MQAEGTSLLNDSHTLAAIRAFIRADKPEGTTPMDVLHVVHLLSRKGEDHAIFDSQQTLAHHFGADIKTIQRSQKRLERYGWLARPQRRGKSCALSLLVENIPFSDAQAVIVTPEAKQLAAQYQTLLQRRGRKKFPRGWLGRQHISAQRILNACKGDLGVALQVVTFAVDSRAHQKRSRQSLYHLIGRWSQIKREFEVSRPRLQPVREDDTPQTLAAEIATLLNLPSLLDVASWQSAIEAVMGSGHAVPRVRSALSFVVDRLGPSTVAYYGANGFKRDFEMLLKAADGAQAQ